MDWEKNKRPLGGKKKDNGIYQAQNTFIAKD